MVYAQIFTGEFYQLAGNGGCSLFVYLIICTKFQFVAGGYYFSVHAAFNGTLFVWQKSRLLDDVLQCVAFFIVAA